MKRRTQIAAGAALIAVAAATTAAVVILRRNKVDTPTQATAPATPPALPSARPSDDEASFVGVVLPPQSVNVASKEDGKVVRIRVRVGDVVHEGDVLAELDDSVKKHELAIARATRKAEIGRAHV